MGDDSLALVIVTNCEIDSLNLDLMGCQLPLYTAHGFTEEAYG